mgnify:CR=1 FL=1
MSIFRRMSDDCPVSGWRVCALAALEPDSIGKTDTKPRSVNYSLLGDIWQTAESRLSRQRAEVNAPIIIRSSTKFM